MRAVVPQLWPVVLAAGRGRRLRSITGDTPKQFWSPRGQPSLLDMTMARVAPIAQPERHTVIVDRTHAPFVREAGWRVGHLLFQPGDCGTAAGVLLALTPALATDQDAVVLVTPSDHAVARPAVFRRSVLDVARTVQNGVADIVIFGVAPEDASTDMGWITSGERYDRRHAALRLVDAFVEKPSPEQAATLFHGGSVWSTMVIVARARALARLYETALPDVARLFAEYRRLPRDKQVSFLEASYLGLATTDFSRDVLTRASNLVVYSWPRALGWLDLGTPGRLSQWLSHRHGRHATHPLAHLQQPA